MRGFLLLSGLIGVMACASRVSSTEADVGVTPADVATVGEGGPCAAGMVYVYAPGCDAPTGRCVTEVTDAGAIPQMGFCGCDGEVFYDSTGARRPIRSAGLCPARDAGIDAGSADVSLDVGVDAGSADVGVDAGSADVGVDAGGDVAPDCSAGPNDWRNCGGCGVVCCGGWCFDGRCGTEGPPGTTSCPSTEAYRMRYGCIGPIPVQPAYDPNNCGGCGVRCETGMACSSGRCVAMTDGG